VTDFLPGLHHIAGGAEHAVARILQEQSQLGLDLHVVTLKPDLSNDLTGPWAARYELDSVDRFARRAAFVVKQFFLPIDPLASIGFRALLDRIRPDVVHFHNVHWASMWTVREAARKGYRIVWSIYDYWLFCPSFMLLTSDGRLCTRGQGAHCARCIGTTRLPVLQPLKAALFAARVPLVTHVRSRVDRFVVLSGASRELLSTQGIDRSMVRVIPLYAWPEAINAPEPDSIVPGRLVYAGWIERRKGLHVVIEALARLPHRPDVHLHVLGLSADAEYRAQIDSRIGELGLADRVTFVGQVSRQRMLDSIRSATLIVVPEQWANMSPVILAEAMSAGACVLGSNVGGVPDLLDDGRAGLLAERDDPASYAAQIEWAVTHPQQVRELGRAARRRARSIFDSSAINDSFARLYDEVRQRASA
jgi:glycosyltransferase involved in cell wall biosynthesis